MHVCCSRCTRCTLAYFSTCKRWHRACLRWYYNVHRWRAAHNDLLRIILLMRTTNTASINRDSCCWTRHSYLVVNARMLYETRETNQALGYSSDILHRHTYAHAISAIAGKQSFSAPVNTAHMFKLHPQCIHFLLPRNHIIYIAHHLSSTIFPLIYGSPHPFRRLFTSWAADIKTKLAARNKD
jgi:hypothetical protein